MLRRSITCSREPGWEAGWFRLRTRRDNLGVELDEGATQRETPPPVVTFNELILDVLKIVIF